MGATVAVPLNNEQAKSLQTMSVNAKMENRQHHPDDSKITMTTEKDRCSVTDEERERDGRYQLPVPPSDAKHAPSSPRPAEAQRLSLLETMLLTHPAEYTHTPQTVTRCVFQPSPDELTVGDIVRPCHKSEEDDMDDNSHDSSALYEDDAYDAIAHPDDFAEGIIIEKLSSHTVMVDFGEKCRAVPLDDCTLLLRSDEFENGDKVEAKPLNSNLYFVGRVIRVDSVLKRIDVLMDGDDPNDIERDLPFENARKLVSRRNVVVNRWKRAFMMVVAANFFKQIPLNHHCEEKKPPLSPSSHAKATDEKDAK